MYEPLKFAVPLHNWLGVRTCRFVKREAPFFGDIMVFRRTLEAVMPSKKGYPDLVGVLLSLESLIFDNLELN